VCMEREFVFGEQCEGVLRAAIPDLAEFLIHELRGSASVSRCRASVPGTHPQRESSRMKKNMGTIDRVVRTLIAAVLVVLIFAGQITGAWAIVGGVVAAAFLLTSAVSWCPAYLPLGITSRPRQSPQP
jgi:hypothetical protein